MNELDFLDKIKTMLVNLQIDTLNDCQRLFNSGGIDPEEFGNDYLLPKIILHVALQNQADQYRPLQEEGREQANNLRNF